MDKFMRAAIDEALKGGQTGGVPIGSVLVLDGQIVGRGHNKLAQESSVILHAETDAINNAGVLNPDEYRRSILYTTLSPCAMCSGAVVYFSIPKVVIGENKNFMGEEEYLKSLGVELEILNDSTCIKLLSDLDRISPGIWEERND